MVTSRVSRKKLDAAGRRASLVAAAAEVFAAAGYERARMSDVARRVGVTEPVVFQNFGTKAALFAATLDHVAGAFADHVAGLAAGSPDALQVIDQLTRPEEFRRLHRRGGAGVLFADAVAHRSAGQPRLALGRVHAALVELVARGQQEGSIRRDVDAATLAWWVISNFPAHAFRQAHGGLSLGDEDALHRLLVGSLQPR